MTLRSSIFSFETLQRPRTAPAAALAALCVVAALELTARALLGAGVLGADPSLRQLVTTQLARLKDERPALWMLGNSTLANGVDEAALTRGGASVVRLTHGSATVGGTAAMLDYYLQRAQAPRQVLIFATLDDFNPNGMRAEVSREYAKIDATGKLPKPELLALRAVRASLKTKLFVIYQRLRGGKSEAAGGGDPQDGVFSGEPIPPGSNGFAALARDYAVQADAFPALAAAARRRGIGRVTLVLLPITDRLADWHDRSAPTLSYARVRATVKEECEKSGLAFVDWGEPLSDYSLFKDPYHLNARGRAWLTQKVQRELL